ncbi:aspartate/glutamate racemase family protein [Deinococcus rubellus]|uniref:aspartate/glutamate racemase family protein n=1 Tax=Deinococcus rubellus TaxID=1889240 RepID=UPI0031E6363F
MKRVLWLNPVGHDQYDQDMLHLFQQEAEPDTEIVVRSLTQGPHHLEYHAYGALVLPECLRELRRAEQEGFDAAVMGCFYDPGVKEIREMITAMPVIFPEETCVSLAATMGDRFSILVGRRKWIPAMLENVERYGQSRRLASFVSLDLGVLEFQQDHQRTEQRMTQAAQRAVEEDGAEVLILGCTMEYGFARRLQDQLGIPVLDATVTPFKYAEFRAGLKQRYGWSHSKHNAYESPPDSELRQWNLPL